VKRIVILMHRWVGYLHGVQLGIADFAMQRPDWVLANTVPDTDSFKGLSTVPVDGVIAYTERHYIPQLLALRVPVVDISNWLDPPTFPRVVPDDEAIGRMGAEYLLDLGLKQMGVAGRTVGAYYVERRKGFMDVCARAGVPVDVYDPLAPAPPGQQTPVAINPTLLAWLRSVPKPAGIFCSNDGMAEEILEVCRRSGIRVPEELCVLGVDNDELTTRMTHPPLSSIELHTQKIGYEAAKLLDELLNGRPGGPGLEIKMPPVGVVARQSTNLLAIADPDVLTAVRFIRDNIHKHITVGSLLKLLPVNRRFLERRFKEHLGRTPLQEIRRVRIEKAKELLSGTDLSMPAVAKRSGFANPERLANVFHASIGMTPTAYRRKFRLHDF